MPPPNATGTSTPPMMAVPTRTAGRGDHGVDPESWMRPTVSLSLTPYHTDGAIEIGSPTASLERFMLTVEPAIRILPLNSVSGGAAGSAPGSFSGGGVASPSGGVAAPS